MIELKNVSKYFNGQLIIDNISLAINKGEVLSFIGPSGSGKSSLLRLINFLSLPDQGTIFFKNEEITEGNSNKLRAKIGMVFQEFNLFPHMTVLENISYAPVNVLGIDIKQANLDARELLSKLGMLDKENLFPHSLSGGQKQRIAIARSLAMNPEILLFDEPTSALDPEMTAEIHSIISSFIDSGLTIALVTHDLNFAKKIASRVIFLDKGKIIEDRLAQDFFSSPTSARAKEFLAKVM